MDIVNFSNSEFWQIPRGDNPAYDKNAECVLIIKSSDYDNMIEILTTFKGFTGKSSCEFIALTFNIDIAYKISECIANEK